VTIGIVQPFDGAVSDGDVAFETSHRPEGNTEWSEPSRAKLRHDAQRKENA
jgi:hypothetical protein